MREDARHQFGFGPLERPRNAVTLYELGDFRTDHVRAQELAGLCIEHGLHKPFRLTERNRLAVADERELADLDLAPGFFGLGLGQSDACDLRPAIGAARNL